ncbi:MAG TPA: hypothetical protein VFW73_01860, partial [Lacipirellulaceae bacterium]|nr:hypothetical protein [Lacipirellulaceae bacterium]
AGRMNSFLLVLGVALFGQFRGSGDRYPPSSVPAGQGGTANVSGTGARGNTGQAKSASRPTNNFDNRPASPSGSGGKQSESMRGSRGPSSQQSPGFPFSDTSVEKPQTGVKPAALMRAMLTPMPGSQLRGTPVRLIEVISTGNTRTEQSRRVDAYWDLCSSVADYYLGLREQDEFRKLGTYVSQPAAAWQQAGKELDVRIDTSLRAARASQLRLASLIGRSANSVPLPADMLHCGTYISHYEQIFAGRNSPEAYDLAQLLPLRYAELKNTAAGVSRAEDLLDSSVRGQNSDGTAGIEALELLALRRRAFVQIARDYNRRIARYAELAMPGEIGAERLADMLIIRPGSSNSTPSSTSAPPGKRQSSDVETSPPRTFVNEWSSAIPGETKHAAKRDEAVHPASANETVPRTEHSLIVPPR